MESYPVMKMHTRRFTYERPAASPVSVLLPGREVKTPVKQNLSYA
jgi:hypothetical protein